MNPDPPRTPPLTGEQSRPLAVDGASVALDAGAGCGKTTVLTARFLGDLEGEGRQPLRSIVALTFTVKAARELRQRIRDRCRDELAAGAFADAAGWRSLLRGLEAAPIGTFHEFCGHWLRRHAVEAGIDPDFTIFDASIAGAIRDEVLGRCLREWLAACDPDLIELAVEFSLARVREALALLASRRAIGDLDPWADRSADEIIGKWQVAWEEEGRAARLQKLAQAARRCVAFLADNDCDHPRMRERRAALLERLPGVLEPSGPEFSTWLGEIKEQARVQGGGGKDAWANEEVYDQVKRHLEELRKEIDDFVKKARWDEDATREAAEFGRRLARLATRFQRAFAAAKRARGGLDFDDLLIATRDLLRARPDLAGIATGGRISRLLVDEFQDTDEVQGEILRRLVGGEFAEGRLFLVGDFKQSIYRFRGAEPLIFQRFRDEFPAQGHHALTENFRSVPAILDFVNALFEGAFPGRPKRLVPGPKGFEPDDQPAVEFLWAAEDEAEGEGDEKSRLQAHDRRKTEARWIARRLRQRLDAGALIRDPRTRERRPAHAGDVALLFRAMTDVGPYESALAEEGFDYHVIGGSAFYMQQEVHDLINVLSVVEDPLDDVAMVGALRSPFFCVSDDGLYWLATARSGELPEGLRSADAIDELSTSDRTYAVRARDLLDRWRDLKDRVPIATLVDRVLDESGYEAALLGEYLGARKRANARKLVRMARQFDQEGGFTVADFVARLRDDLRKPPREEQASTTDESGTSVRLMTIHQAKGLEFPIVVLPDLNRKPVGSRDFVAFHPGLGPLVRLSRDPEPGDEADSEGTGQSLGWLTYQSIDRRDEDDEALRLLYVATTRARDVLILSAGLGPAEKAASPAMALLDSRFDRTDGTCRVPLPDDWAVPSVLVTRECPPRFETARHEGAGRPDLPDVAKTIVAASVSAKSPLPPSSHRPRRPRYVDLDPAHGLSPTLARLDRLIHALLADPRLLVVRDKARAVAQAARGQQPAAPARLVAAAMDRLRPWIDVERGFGRAMAEASAIDRGIPWMIGWPPQAPDRTVFQGKIDLLYRDRQDDWNAVVVSLDEAPLPRERLRLLLGARALTALGQGPIRHGWQVRLGPVGGLHGFDRFEQDAIDATMNEALMDS